MSTSEWPEIADTEPTDEEEALRARNSRLRNSKFSVDGSSGSPSIMLSAKDDFDPPST